MLFIGLGVASDEVISPELLADLQERFRKLQTACRMLNANTIIRFNLNPEGQMVEAIRHRTWAGLAPDLLLVNGETARELLECRQSGGDPWSERGRRRPAAHPRRTDRHRGLAGLAAERQQPATGDVLRQPGVCPARPQRWQARLDHLPQHPAADHHQADGGPVGGGRAADGAAGAKASPINRLRVLTLGRNSTARPR